jgi:hypothetical protein
VQKVVCYTIPLAAAVISSIAWRFKRGGPVGFWLVLLLCGGALFGVVDHLWNGELFLIGENIVSDLLLGCTITGTMFGGWGIILGIAKINPDLGYRMGILRQNKR